MGPFRNGRALDARPPGFRGRALASLVALSFLLPGCLIFPKTDRHGVLAFEQGHDLVGAWLGAWPSDSDPLITDFETLTGAELDLVDVYVDWFTPFANVSHSLDHIANRGAIPIITWEAQTITTRDILAGTRQLALRDGSRVALDAYLESFSQGVCDLATAHDQPFLVRMLHEMNGHWFAWGISHELEGGERPNSDDSYHAAWKKIHQSFQGKCGSQVKFVWALNHFSVGEGATFLGPYPGDEYVDFVGIDGYNWGTRAEWGWQSFEELFTPAYCAVVGRTQKEILVAETASTERGGDKAEWIHDLFRALERYPQIRGVVWFNDAKFEIEVRGNMDWPLSSSNAATAAFSEEAQRLQAGRDRADEASGDAADAPVVRC